MLVHLSFELPREIDKYASAINGSKYRLILERLEEALDPEACTLLRAIKLDVMSEGPIEKIKGKSLE